MKHVRDCRAVWRTPLLLGGIVAMYGCLVYPCLVCTSSVVVHQRGHKQRTPTQEWQQDH